MVSVTSSPPREALDLDAFARTLHACDAPAWVFAMRSETFADIAWRRGRDVALALERRVTANLRAFVAQTLRRDDALVHEPESDLFALALIASPRLTAAPGAVADRRTMLASIENTGRAAAGVEVYGSWTRVEPGDDVRETLAAAARRGRATAQRQAFASLLHDLATPVSSIHASLAAAVDGVLPPETERRFLRASHDEAARMGRMIRGFLSTELEEDAACDAFDLLGRALEAVGPLARERDVTLKMCSRSGASPIAMNADRALSVFVALVENAVKHGRCGGNVKARALDAGGACRIEVDDDGPGVGPGDAQRIFAFGVRDGSSPGYGIGLALARTLVTAAGGEICVERSPLGGARFAVTLPRSRR